MIKLDYKLYIGNVYYWWVLIWCCQGCWIGHQIMEIYISLVLVFLIAFFSLIR